MLLICCHRILVIVNTEHWMATNLRIYPDKRNPNDLKPIVRKPYAIKATPCGFQGSYLRLAKAFIEDPSQLSENYGDLNKVLAAEWAKFRWGVFDDSPPPNAGRDFYATQSFVEASKCSLEIKVGFRVYSKDFFLKDFLNFFFGKIF